MERAGWAVEIREGKEQNEHWRKEKGENRVSSAVKRRTDLAVRKRKGRKQNEKCSEGKGENKASSAVKRRGRTD